jgi:hypothetical protein
VERQGRSYLINVLADTRLLVANVADRSMRDLSSEVQDFEISNVASFETRWVLMDRSKRSGLLTCLTPSFYCLDFSLLAHSMKVVSPM